MKTSFATLLLLLLAFVCQAQTQRIEEAHLTFELPNRKWALVTNEQANGKHVYIYKRKPIKDASGREVIPNIAFIVEDLPDSTDLMLFTGQRANLSKVTEVFLSKGNDPKINYSNAIGYKGHYTDKGGLEHTVYMVHLLNGNKGVQVILDITSELFEAYEKEFLKTLRSIKAS